MDISRIICLIIGLAICLGGWRIYISILALIGFILGALIIGPILCAILILIFGFGS